MIEIPNCFICFNRLIEAVAVNCDSKHHFDRKYIEQWFKEHDRTSQRKVAQFSRHVVTPVAKSVGKSVTRGLN